MGYRRIWASLKKQKILIRKEDVRKAILELKVEGVQQRKRRKLVREKYRSLSLSYHIWHVDGHDKLKPFGFSVYGCINRFSRKLIWLEVTSLNKEPEIIPQYYLKTVKRLKVFQKK